MNRILAVAIGLAFFNVRVEAARLSLATGSCQGCPSGTLRLDIVWTMQPTDPAGTDLDGIDARFNAVYPAGSNAQLLVLGVSTLPGWSTQVTEGIGLPIAEEDSFFFSTADPTYEGISGNGTVFSTVVGSIFLLAQGNVVGTELTFRHESPSSPIPAAYDGPRIWQLRWQYEVNGPLQFDIGAGNPGDAGGSWTYHGYETYQPLVIVPEPGPLAIMLLSALAMFRFRR